MANGRRKKSEQEKVKVKERKSVRVWEFYSCDLVYCNHFVMYELWNDLIVICHAFYFVLLLVVFACIFSPFRSHCFVRSKNITAFPASVSVLIYSLSLSDAYLINFPIIFNFTFSSINQYNFQKKLSFLFNLVFEIFVSYQFNLCFFSN